MTKAPILRLFWLLGVSTTAFALGGCDEAPNDSSASNSAVNDDRAPTGKADLVGTCTASCGGKSGESCWCDDECEKFGDCCEDYTIVCLGEPSECETMGGTCTFPSPSGCGVDASPVDAFCELSDICCVPDEPAEEPSCEAIGGTCTLPSMAGCGPDASSVDGVCELANDFCCVPS